MAFSLNLNWLVSLLLFITSFGLQAQNQDKPHLSLELICNISFSNFDNIEHTAKTMEITLTGAKHQPGGMQLVTQTDNYEFWVMTHSVQTIGNQRFISNFQVAIKHKPDQLFMHALSDTSYSPDHLPRRARISLVDYHPDTALEAGELIFDCKHID